MTTLRPYQQKALTEILDLYANGHARVTAPMPTGTGKTVLAAHLISTINKRSIMFVPTVELLAQTTKKIREDNPNTPIIAVCSDTTIGEGTPEHLEAARTGQIVTTDPDLLATHLTATPLIVISTYASATTITTATQQAGITWDLMICDEAHRTAGLANRDWSQPLHNTHIPATKRLFLTATTRTVQPPKPNEDIPNPEDLAVVSMDSLKDYGPHISTITLRDAINQGILSDYEVAIIGVDDLTVLKLIQETPSDTPLDPYAAATQLALLHAHETHPHLQSILAFHNRIVDSRQWTHQFRELAAVDNKADITTIYHVDGSTPTHVRRQALEHLASPEDDTVIVSNCRLFAEGVDVPSLDGVLFAAPRSSTVDIVQIVGRALRPHPTAINQKALIILPVINASHSDDSLIKKIAASTHLAAWQVLISLTEVDEQVYKTAAKLQSDLIYREDDKEERPILSVDTSMLAEGASIPFTLQTLSPITSHHPQTIAHLRNFLATEGHANPGLKTLWHGYPLGPRLTAARTAYKKEVLPKGIIKMYEDVAGFEWEPARRATRNTDQWIDLMENYVGSTGVKIIEPYSMVTDTITGEKAAIGKKLHDYRWLRGLSETQKQRIRGFGLRKLPAGL